MTKENELVIFQQISPLAVFKENKVDDFLKRVAEEVIAFKKIRDMSTPKGRSEIKSFSFKIAQTKAPLDKAGLNLTEEARSKINLINAERKRVKEALQAFQDDVRQPLTDYENKEEARIAEKQDRIFKMEDFRNRIIDSSKMANDLMIDLSAMYNGGEKFNWEEFEHKAKTIYEDVNLMLADKREILKKRESEQAELEKLRKEKAERDQKDRDEQLIKEAEEKIKREEREKAERVAKETEQERYRLEAEKKEQEDKARLAEARQTLTERRNQLLTIGVAYDATKDDYFILPELKERVELNASQPLLKDEEEWEKTLESVIEQVRIKKKALADEAAKQAEIQAEKDKEEAVKVERARLEAEKQKEIEAEKAREEDVKHRTKINNEAAKGIAGYLIDEYDTELNLAKRILTGIANGKVPHIFIKY